MKLGSDVKIEEIRKELGSWFDEELFEQAKDEVSGMDSKQAHIFGRKYRNRDFRDLKRARHIHQVLLRSNDSYKENFAEEIGLWTK